MTNEPKSLESKLILVADDEPDIVNIVEIILKSKGYGVLKAANGLEALELAERYNPDLILLDIMMPDMDGWEVLRLLSVDPSTAGIPVAMISAKTSSRAKIASMQEGAVDYITKPFDSHELLSKVREILADRS
ncbi:MAG TPA: response regulator [Candidatus Coatesbacteria bacterium]|nr:response regulator [Candidatus Coatesbacteria bacterium]